MDLSCAWGRNCGGRGDGGGGRNTHTAPDGTVVVASSDTAPAAASGAYALANLFDGSNPAQMQPTCRMPHSNAHFCYYLSAVSTQTTINITFPEPRGVSRVAVRPVGTTTQRCDYKIEVGSTDTRWVDTSDMPVGRTVVHVVGATAPVRTSLGAPLLRAASPEMWCVAVLTARA